MKKMILVALALGLFGISLAGCHAAASVDPHESSSVQLPR
jgi:hypothetical protein